MTEKITRWMLACACVVVAIGFAWPRFYSSTRYQMRDSYQLFDKHTGDIYIFVPEQAAGIVEEGSANPYAKLMESMKPQPKIPAHILHLNLRTGLREEIPLK